MDSLDKRILRALQANGRITWLQLAEQVHLSASACQRRVEALIRDGVIEGFTVRLSEAALGFGVRAFIDVNIDRQKTDQVEDFRREILKHPNVQACHMVSGNIDFILDVVADSLDSFSDFIDGDLLTMPAVKDASSAIVLRKIKPFRAAIGD
jgi:Lrp/AsnC family leucine-responsive transcriptional regulator